MIGPGGGAGVAVQFAIEELCRAVFLPVKKAITSHQPSLPMQFGGPVAAFINDDALGARRRKNASWLLRLCTFR